MSLLAAAVPVAVLVLAWDEATPAVRALVEATEAPAPALDSVVVLVPAAAGALTQEEFLPLGEEPTPPVAIPGEDSAPVEAAVVESETEPAENTSLLPAPTSLPPAPTAPVELLATAAAAATLEKPAPKPLAWSVVRVLRLSSFSLPELTELSHQALPLPIWQQSAGEPAAPYLGSQFAALDNQAPGLPEVATAPRLVAGSSGSWVATLPLSPTSALPEQPLPPLPVAAPDYPTAELTALDAEADLVTLPSDLSSPERLPVEVPHPIGAAQAGWPEALAALHDPLPIEEPAPATDLEDEATYYAATADEPLPAADTGPAELQPPNEPFESPNLNFQVIQYARFAVPVALAQMPFAVIYAPTWPTWLAAQELRYRTRQPLVLHVATLAADAADSVETATGWQAELQRQALQRADLILAETPELAHRLRHDLELPLERVRVVPAASADAVALALRTAQLRPNVSAS